MTLTSCSLFSKSSEQDASLLGPVTKTYASAYNNVDAGQIETEDIKGLDVWSPPHKAKVKQPGLRYNFKVVLIRGEKLGKPATEVIIEKHLRIAKNFFATDKRLPSDGLEEESIHYRIQRELTIERALDKAYEQGEN